MLCIKVLGWELLFVLLVFNRVLTRARAVSFPDSGSQDDESLLWCQISSGQHPCKGSVF